MNNDDKNMIDLLARIVIESMSDHPEWMEDYESENGYQRSEDTQTDAPVSQRIA